MTNHNYQISRRDEKGRGKRNKWTGKTKKSVKRKEKSAERVYGRKYRKKSPQLLTKFLLFKIEIRPPFHSRQLGSRASGCHGNTPTTRRCSWRETRCQPWHWWRRRWPRPTPSTCSETKGDPPPAWCSKEQVGCRPRARRTGSPEGGRED